MPLASFSPKSSHIQKVDYDQATQQLFITFANGARYRYDKFPAEAFRNFEKYPSAGKFHAQVVKRYRSTPLDKEEKT
jgi:hypothetical protein